MKFLEAVNRSVWGVHTLALILAVGVWITIRTGFVQIRLFPEAIRQFAGKFRSRKDNPEDTSPYRALCTALAATVGTGNLAGVAGAISIGGAGSIFWMWVCAFLGMGIKFAEASLAVRYRRRRGNEWVGGPMYMIRDGLNMPILAGAYALFGVVAAFGVGNATQINTVVKSINSTMGLVGVKETPAGDLVMGVLLGALVLTMLLGGAKRIGETAEKLVPFASAFYLLLGALALALRWQEIPGAFARIVTGAFSPRSVTGGAVGSVFLCLRIGTSRGIFTNEAGMGTASIAHASAGVEHPAEQGMMGIVEVFLDTIVICTMTALVILCSGVPVNYGSDEGIGLTIRAFSSLFGDWITIPIMLTLCCFAFATVLGWGLYGIRCAQYLFGENVWKPFAFLQCAVVVVSAVLGTGTVWMISETVNGMMAIPNLIALGLLTPELVRLTRRFSPTAKRPGKLDKTDGFVVEYP